MNDPVTIILSGKWAVADLEIVDTTTHVTLYEENSSTDTGLRDYCPAVFHMAECPRCHQPRTDWTAALAATDAADKEEEK